ncbi:MAG: hypothetical protein KF754_12760 [Planctomycetes bacterium]|nr:hypothetical protein [Planctomycetota bacterium]
MWDWLTTRIPAYRWPWLLGTGIGVFIGLGAAFSDYGAIIHMVARFGYVALGFVFVGLLIWLMTIPAHKRNIW